MSDGRAKRIIFDSKLKAEQDYWIEKLSRPRGESSLAPDFQRSAGGGATKASIDIALDEDLTQKLGRVTGNSDFLLYTFLVAALKVCLHKYIGSNVVVVGSPAHRYTDDPAQSANALAIVDEVDGPESFKGLLLRVRETLKEAYAHQDYPYDRVIGDLGIEAHDRCPLFDVAISLDNLHGETLDVGCEVTITLHKAPAGISGRVEYASGLFLKTTIERFRQHFVVLLRSALENVEILVADLQMSAEIERHALLVEWNDTQTDAHQEPSVDYLIEAQAEIRPDAVAVSYENEHLTYREMNRRANQLAHSLRSSGVGPESRVGIYLGRSLDMIVALLGVLKAGGAYVPLDPLYPQERLAFMLRDSGAQLVLTQEQFRFGVPLDDIEVLAVDADREMIALHSVENPTREGCLDNLAYVIYTSGTTGQPKGVMLAHRGACNLASAQARAFGINSSSRVLQFASLSFDASVSEIFTALTTGATLELGSHDLLFAGSALGDVLRALAITVVTLPPSVLATMEALGASSLETLVTAGEACPSQLVERFAADRRLVNAYGPTEATVCATLLECTQAGPNAPPIGRPLANTQVYILDDSLNPLPAGIKGELYIGGIGLARGYLNRPDLTAEKFRPNPYDSRPGAMLYKTGDLAHYLPDGNVAFFGRIDHQVKIRGYRVELGEIEALLCEYPSIRESVAVAAGESEDLRIIAYIVSDQEPAPSAAELRHYLQQRLPGYMVPSVFVTLTALPLTPSGKIDREKLPPPGHNRPELSEEFVPPRTPMEEQVAQVFCEVLTIAEVGVFDNFFELGGHSLLATQVVSRVQEIFNVEILVRTVFEAPTVAELAVAIVQSQAEAAANEEMPDILAEIEHLSEGEAAAFAAEEKSTSAFE